MIVAVPTSTAVIIPASSTVATFSFEDDQISFVSVGVDPSGLPVSVVNTS